MQHELVEESLVARITVLSVFLLFILLLCPQLRNEAAADCNRSAPAGITLLFVGLFWLDTFSQFTSNTLPQKQLVASHCMSGAIVSRTTSVVSSIFVWMLVECGSRCVFLCSAEWMCSSPSGSECLVNICAECSKNVRPVSRVCMRA